MGQQESLCKRSNHLFDRSGSRPQSPSRVQTLVGIISAMNRAKAMSRRELGGRKAGRLETKVPSMRNNARRTGAEVGAHHERALFPLASPSRSKSVRPHPDRPDRRLFSGGNPRAKLARACPHLLGARVRPTTRCGGKAQLVLPPACGCSTAQGTEANGPAQLVLLLVWLLRVQVQSRPRFVLALWNQLCDSALEDPHNGERSDARKGCPVSAP